MVKLMDTICPFCEKNDVKLKNKKETVIINNEKIEYDQKVFICSNCGIEFENGELLDVNLNECRNQYRIKHNLLTSTTSK